MRWSDMDYLRHINNVAFLRYLEDARIDLLWGRGTLARRQDEGVMVVRHEIDYRRQLDYRHTPVPIEMWVSRIGNGSFTIAAEIVDTDEAGKRTLYARAFTTLATVDLEHGHPRRVSAELRTFLEQFEEQT
jgi:acyl-CoA thioester hydrolase